MNKLAQPGRVKFRFLAWLGLVSILMVIFCLLLGRGAYLNTNVLDLLPSVQDQAVVKQAEQHFSKTLSQQVVFLVADPEQNIAQQAALSFVTQLQKNPAIKISTFQVDASAQQAWGSFYFPYRLGLLTAQQYSLLAAGNTQKIMDNALQTLYSPLGLASSALLEQDPYFLYQGFITSLPKPASNLDLYNNFLMTQAKGQWYVLITAQLQEQGFSLTQQNQILASITQAQLAVKAQYPQSSFLQTGVLFYAKAGTDQAKHDISTIGIGSLLGIILLLLWTFRSVTPLFFTLFSSAIGFMAAFVVTYLVFGCVYLFTLVFGASLIGICVDYAMFYYADRSFGGAEWQALAGLKRILPGISLGLLNVVLAFLIIALAPFPGLRQLAVFASVGLALAYLTVVCVFPVLLKGPTQPAQSWLLQISNTYLKLWKNLTNLNFVLIYGLLALVITIGLIKLHSNDDIRILQGLPPVLVQDEQNLKTIMGSQLGTNFLIVQGAIPDQTLAHAQQVTQIIKTTFPNLPQPYLAISDYIPTIASQEKNFALMQNLLTDNQLLPYLSKLGMPPEQAKTMSQQLQAIKFAPLTVQAWLASPVSDSLRYLWLGQVAGAYATIIMLANDLNTQVLQQALQPYTFVTYVDKTAQVSMVFKHYRSLITGLLIFAFAVLFVLLLLRYGLQKAKYYFLPPVTACLLGVAILGWFDIPLTLFNILALVLVLGLAVDYVLFFAESRASYQSTMLAVLLSALTTILSFGLLAFSATPVIHYFGITVFVGVASAFLLAPLVVRIRPEIKEDL